MTVRRPPALVDDTMLLQAPDVRVAMEREPALEEEDGHPGGRGPAMRTGLSELLEASRTCQVSARPRSSLRGFAKIERAERAGRLGDPGACGTQT